MIALTITPEELDAAILDALRRAGGFAPWADIRDQLPESSSFWERVQSAVRLQQTGQIDVVKLDGRNYVSLPL